MTPHTTCLDTLHAGLPCRELALPSGERVTVALHGAQVLSWHSGGRERLYLSPRSVMDGQAAIRGGVPVCFPQFNQRGPLQERLPKHGFARNLPWQADAPELLADRARITLHLSDSEATRAWWPHAFALALQIELQPGSLQIGLQVHNSGAVPWAFTGALHTYLAVPDATQTQLHGLGGQAEWDSLTDTHASAADTLRFGPEFDRVYAAAPKALTLQHSLQIRQSASWANTVVWNPGEALCSRLADMPPDGWRHMLCVEAAQVFAPITLAAGERWTGWQRLQLVSPL
jgi:glucose-6-phosphate 1-epimerase